MKRLTLASIYRNDHQLNDSQTNNPATLTKQTLDNKALLDNRVDFTGSSPVLIDNQPIDFLLDIIRDQCEFRVLNDRVWGLRYFVGSPYEQTLFVSFADCPATHPDILTYLPAQCDLHINEFINHPRKIVNAVFIETSQYEPTTEVIHYASYLVRDTASLAFDTLTRHSDRFVHVDGRGTVLLSPNRYHLQTFRMQVILLALAKAYLLATSSIVSELGECCEDFAPLRRLYKQAVIFNAKSYFACPVKVNRYDAYTLWQDIRKTMPIDDINNEIVQQVESIHRLLSEEEDAIQYQNELKISNRLGWMGIAIGALSLVSIFEITPHKVIEFVSSWWYVFF